MTITAPRGLIPLAGTCCAVCGRPASHMTWPARTVVHGGRGARPCVLPPLDAGAGHVSAGD